MIAYIYGASKVQTDSPKSTLRLHPRDGVLRQSSGTCHAACTCVSTESNILNPITSHFDMRQFPIRTTRFGTISPFSHCLHTMLQSFHSDQRCPELSSTLWWTHILLSDFTYMSSAHRQNTPRFCYLVSSRCRSLAQASSKSNSGNVSCDGFPSENVSSDGPFKIYNFTRLRILNGRAILRSLWHAYSNQSRLLVNVYGGLATR
jgi:hypothetical protein